MYCDELIRHKLFFLIDRLRGGILSKAISELNEYEKLTTAKKIEQVTNSFKKFAADCTLNVPFYATYTHVTSLSVFPVVSKKKIAASPEQFHNQRFEGEKRVSVHTSGSYGVPLTFLLTASKKKRQQAEVVYYGRKCGFDIGSRHGYFRSVCTKSDLKLWLQNETFFGSKRLNEEFISTSIKSLNQKRPGYLIGFPSAIAYLASQCTALGYRPADFKLKGVITQSENLTRYHREVIGRAFNCPVHNRYSTEELGVLGCEYEHGEGFELNTRNYIIEVLALDSDTNVGVGEIGRIVVTDLYSNAMPLVRYETGDLGVVGSFLDRERGWVASLQALSGRMMQLIYDTTGSALYPLYFDNIMDTYSCFSHYQLIQQDATSYSVNLVCNDSFERSGFSEEHFISILRNWLGTDASVAIQFVDDIEMLPSGKRPFIINKLIDTR